MTDNYDKKFERHATLVPLDKLAATRVMMIGLGSFGSWTLINLIKMGIKKIQAWDFDQVDVANFANQIYSHVDAGEDKTSVMSAIINDYFDEDEECTVSFVKEKFTGGLLKHDILISAVDNMQARKDLWASAKNSLRPQLFLDARMAGTGVQCYCVDLSKKEDKAWFDDPDWENLFNDDEAEPLKCTEKGIIFGAQMGALHYANAIAAWASGTLEDYPRWIEYDLTWKKPPLYNWREGAACHQNQRNVSSI